MLMPTGLSKSQRKKYIEENSKNIRGPRKSSRGRRENHPGLRPVGVAPVDEPEKGLVEEVTVDDDVAPTG